MRFLLTSKSSIKLPLAKQIITSLFPLSTLDGITINSSKIPEQPLDQDIVKAAFERIHFCLISYDKTDEYDYIISLESGINTLAGEEVCICMILDMKTAKLYRGVSYPIRTPHYFVLKMLEDNEWTGDMYGSSKTMGQCIADVFPWIEHKRWMEYMHKIPEMYEKEMLKNHLPMIPYCFSMGNGDIENVSDDELNAKYDEMMGELLNFEYHSREEQIADSLNQTLSKIFGF